MSAHPRRSSEKGKKQLDKRRRERNREHHPDPDIDLEMQTYGSENVRIIQDSNP